MTKCLSVWMSLNKFIGLFIARSVIDDCTLHIKSMWSATRGCNLFKKTMKRNRVLKIIQYL